ncbi:MAG: hypothetical protein ACRDLD_02355 [Thermoleophilaceae bacterium]
MKLNWQNGEWLDSERLADWLEGWLRCRYDLHPDEPIGETFGDSVMRTMWRWRHEDVVPSVHTLDRILTAHGGHLSNVPDDLWVPQRPSKRAGARLGRGSSYYQKRRKRLPEYDGQRAFVAAQALGVDQRTVRSWRKQEAAR